MARTTKAVRSNSNPNAVSAHSWRILFCTLLPCAISRAPRDVGDQAFRTAQRARCKTLPVTTARRASECPNRGLALLS